MGSNIGWGDWLISTPLLMTAASAATDGMGSASAASARSAAEMPTAAAPAEHAPATAAIDRRRHISWGVSIIVGGAVRVIGVVVVATICDGSAKNRAKQTQHRGRADSATPDTPPIANLRDRT